MTAYKIHVDGVPYQEVAAIDYGAEPDEPDAEPAVTGKPSRAERRAARAKQGAVTAAQRLARARGRMKRAVEHDSRCLVALSGGKDSLVTLDLACQTFDHVEAFYMYLVPGLMTFEAPVDAAARRYGVKVHKVPHFDLPRLIKYAVLRPHLPTAASIRELRWADVNQALREQTGIKWVATGERASDSLQRRFYTKQLDGVQWHIGRLFPVYDWLDSDVHGYLRARNIPLPSNGGFSRQRGSGFSLEGRGLSWLKQQYPEDYRRVLKVFPYAEAEVIRYERREKVQRARAERGES